jgi:hypothetical protein
MKRASMVQEQVKLNRSGRLFRRMLVWAHEIDLAQGLPYALVKLQKLCILDLRFIARMCPSWVHQESLHRSRNDLIQWILGDQPQQLLLPWAPPIRAENVQTFKEIRPPKHTARRRPRTFLTKSNPIELLSLIASL